MVALLSETRGLEVAKFIDRQKKQKRTKTPFQYYVRHARLSPTGCFQRWPDSANVVISVLIFRIGHEYFFAATVIGARARLSVYGGGSCRLGKLWVTLGVEQIF